MTDESDTRITGVAIKMRDGRPPRPRGEKRWPNKRRLF